MGFDQGAVDEIDGQDISPASVSADDAQIPSELPQDESGSRSAGTWYQNTTDYPLHVTVVYSVSGAGNLVAPNLDVNTSQSKNRVDICQVVAHDSQEVRASVSNLVPQDAYYRVDLFGDSPSLVQWREVRVGAQ